MKRSARVRALTAVALVAGALSVVATQQPSSAAIGTFSNTNSIDIPRPTAPPGCPSFPFPNNSCPPTPALAEDYPSPISVSGLTGTVADVNVTLHDLTYRIWDASDLDVLLVAPNGTAIQLMSDVCGHEDLPNQALLVPTDLTFDDLAPPVPPDTVCSTAGQPVTFKPTDEDDATERFPATGEDVYCGPNNTSYPTGRCNPDGAPVSPLTTLPLSTFNGIDPNGTWKLYAVDDVPGDPNCWTNTHGDTPPTTSNNDQSLSCYSGQIGGGWSLDITTSAPNRSPVAFDDAYSTTEDTALTVPAPGVLGNDTDADGDALSAGSASTPTHGSVALNANGSFTYTPAADYTGADSFTYVVSDGRGGSDTGLVTLTVTAVNDAPVAVDDFYRTAAATQLTVAAPGVLGNDTDAEGDQLTAGSATQPASGSVTLNSDGSFTYIPIPLFTGRDTFTYTASGQGGSDTATVTITVGAVNDAPVAGDDVYNTSEDSALTVPAPGVVANDSDANGDTLTAGSVTDPPGGAVTLNADGSFTYTPDANFAGPDSFTYTVTDDRGGSDTGLVTINVGPVNDAPVAVDDAYTTSEDTPLVVPAAGVLANDSDVDGPSLAAVVAAGPGRGSVSLDASGSFTYTPIGNVNGTDSFTYRANDGAAESNVATVAITVIAVNDAPTCGNVALITNRGTPGSTDPACSDVEGDALSYAIAAQPGHGSASVVAGKLHYTPNPGYDGPDAFTYRANDGIVDSEAVTVSVTVNPANVETGTFTNGAPVVLPRATAPPFCPNFETSGGCGDTAKPYPSEIAVAMPGAVTDVNVTLDGLWHNFYGPNDLDIMVVSPGGIGVMLMSDACGIDADSAAEDVVINPEGAVTLGFDDEAGALLPADASQAQGCVSGTFRPVDDEDENFGFSRSDEFLPPVIRYPDYQAGGDPGELGDTPSITNSASPDYPTPDTTVLSALDGANPNGAWKLYVMDDMPGDPCDCPAGAITGGWDLQITTDPNMVPPPVNHAPDAVNDAYDTFQNVPLSVPAHAGVLYNDTDPDGHSLTARAISDPPRGSVTVAPDGSFTYTPDAGFSGADRFFYTASDGNGRSDTATVTDTVAPAPPPPPPAVAAGTACGYYTDVSLFGGPSKLKGCGSAVPASDSSYSPSVTLPAGGSAAPLTATDTDGAKGEYGPATIFGGIWPWEVASPPPSGPISVSTQGTTAGGSVTSSAEVGKHPTPVPVVCEADKKLPHPRPTNCTAPGGFGPGPVYGEVARSTCSASASGVSASTTVAEGRVILEDPDPEVEGDEAVAVIPPEPLANTEYLGRVNLGSGAFDNFRIVVNEQVATSHSMTVNAVHMYLLGPTAVGEMVIGQSRCSWPLNDDFADAQPVSGLSGTAAGSNAGATQEPGEPDHAGHPGGASIWYRWTAPETGQVRFDTCASNLDTSLGVYTGTSVGALSQVASNDNGPTCSPRSEVAFGATAGTDYYIAVDGAIDDTGTIVTGNVVIAWRLVPPGPSSLSIADLEVPEGNTGTTAATFRITRTGNASGSSTVKYKTSGGTATAGTDYAPLPLSTLIFAPGETTKTVTVNVAGDTPPENNETLNLVLSAPSGGTVLSDLSGTATILNDDGAAYLAVDSVTVTEANTGTTQAAFTITRSGSTNGTSTAKYKTSGGTAVAGSDYTGVALTEVSFGPGETTKTVTVDVTGDVNDENNETFNLVLSTPSAGTVLSDASGTATIVDDEGTITPGPATFLSVNNLSVTEGNTGTPAATFTVTRSGNTNGASTVKVKTSGGTAGAADYTAVPLTTLSFAAGETTKTVTVEVTPDTLPEKDETLNLVLSTATGAVIADAAGTATILNDDGSAYLSVDDVSVTETNSGTTVASFTITRSGNTNGASTVNYQTKAGTATTADFTAVALTPVTFAAGETAKTVTVDITGDTIVEKNETFNLVLSTPNGAVLSDASGTATIVSDD